MGQLRKRCGGRAILMAVSATAAGWAGQAWAAQDQYTGQSSTTFSDGGNWRLGVEPGTANDAVFDLTSYANQPTVTAADNAMGLIFGDATGTAAAAVTIGGTGVLTVGTDGIVAYAGSAAATINAPLTLSAGGSTITNNSATTLTLANVSSGSAPITISGSGNVLFSGTTSTTDGSGYLSTSGGIVINSTGTVDFNVSASPVTGTVTVNSGTASFDYGNFNSGPFTTNGTYVVNAGGTLVINAAHSLANYYGAYLTVNGGTVTANYEQYIASLTMTGGTIQNGTTNGELRTDYFGTTPVTTLASSTTATISTNLATENSQYFDFNAASGSTSTGVDLNVTSQITGAGGFIKDGPGTVQLTNNYNTFTGNVTVNAGTLVAAGRSYYTDSGGLGAVNTAGRTVTVNAGGTISLTSNNVFGGGTTTDANNNTIINPNIPTVNVNGGTLTTAFYNVLGNVTIGNGGVIDDNTTDTTYGAFQLLGTVTAAGTTAGTIQSTSGFGTRLGTNTDFIVPNITGGTNGDLFVTANLLDQSPDFGGAAGALTKDGAGTLVLSGSNTFTGNVTVNAGTLVVGGRSYANAGGGLGAVNVPGRTITINAGATVQFTNNNVFGNGSNDDGTANANLPALVLNGGTLTAANVDLATGASTYNVLGNVTLNGGTITSKLDTVDPSPTNPDPITGFPGYPTNDDDVGYAAFQLLGNITITGSTPSTISAPQSGIHLGANTVFDVGSTGSGGPDLVVSASLLDQSEDFASFNADYSQVTSFAPGSLTKIGPGKMALTGTSGYYGPTNISGGTLLVNGILGPATLNGSPVGSSPVTVYPASVLGGTGTITGTVTVAGTITGGSGATAGDTVGTLTTGAQSWTDGGGYVAKVASAGTSNDKLVMSDLSITGSVTMTALALAGATAVPATTQLVLAVDTDTSQVGVFANAITAGNLTLSPNSTVAFSDGKTPVLAEIDNSSGEELILESATLAAAPEPTSLALAAMAAAPLLVRRRRRA